MQSTFVFCLCFVFLSYATAEKVAIVHARSGLCLNPETSYLTIGVKLILTGCWFWGQHTSKSELFAIIKVDNDTQLFRSFKTFKAATDGCIYTGNEDQDPLYTKACDTKDESQQWIVKQVGGRKGEFQLVQKSTGRCLITYEETKDMRATACDTADREQRWKLCGSNGLCKSSY